MKPRSIALALFALVVMLAAAIGGLLKKWPREPGPPPELVPPSWAEYRTSTGHTRHVGKEKIACTACHDYAKSGFANVELAKCAGCHAKEAAQSHHGGKMNTGCLTCHTFSPKSPPTCVGCHTGAHETASAPLVSVHATAPCKDCHRVHERPAVKDADCTGCHEKVTLRHAEHTAGASCRDCHRGHEPAAHALETCAGCHETPKGPRPAGHDSCSTCHKPHDFANVGSFTCSGCHAHAKEATLASALTALHRACTNCHTPHNPTNTAGSCRACHAGVHVEHGKQGACTNCHKPHADDLDVSVAACTSCHRDVAKSDKGAHDGKAPCTACHEAHRFSPPDPKSICTTCHTRQATLVGLNRSHSECTNCHGTNAHEPQAAPPCATCHERERATAPPGHQACTGCHDAHGATVPPLKSCASCHKKESATPHGGLPGGCETCHRPHGDSHKPELALAPPPCVSCHAPKKLPGLHAVDQHAACANCHEPHGPPRDDRATCTGSCHADKRDHEKGAPVCSGCHPFAR